LAEKTVSEMIYFIYLRIYLLRRTSAQFIYAETTKVITKLYYMLKSNQAN